MGTLPGRVPIVAVVECSDLVLFDLDSTVVESALR